MADNVRTVNPLNWGSDVLRSALPVVVDFRADWCGPCRAFDPVVKELSDEYHGRFVFAMADIEENRSIARELGVQTVPTLVIFKDGKRIDEIAGMRPKSDIQRILEQH